MAITINTQAEGISYKDKSFALLRTNPKLTSNVKLITDEEGDIYLSSIKANRTLSQYEYQKYPISSSGEYCRDVAQFYGKLSKDERYQVGREHTDLAVSADFSSQYENLYNYGASFNYTKAYDEQYRMLAPIWLEDKVPSKFIIYRIEDVNFSKKYKSHIHCMWLFCIRMNSLGYIIVLNLSLSAKKRCKQDYNLAYQQSFVSQ